MLLEDLCLTWPVFNLRGKESLEGGEDATG